MRSVLGEALFEARIEQARALGRRFAAVQRRVAEGLSQAEALKEIFGDEPVPRGPFGAWRKGGIWALVPRHVGPRKLSTLSSRGDEGVTARPETQKRPSRQLSLSLDELPPEAGVRPGKPFRSLLRIPGTKARWVERLAERCPARFERYFEPFVGGGALFFELKHTPSVLADLNAEFVNLYEVLRDRVEVLIEALSAYENTEAAYYRARAVNPETLSRVERAARTWFLNQTCFNGIYRVNKAGLFNVPYGSRNRMEWGPFGFLRAPSRLLRSTELRVGDFETGLAGCGARDFAYLDPPYDLLPGAQVLRYQRDVFSASAQERLADVVRNLDRKGALFLLSNTDTPRIRALYRGFEIEAVEIPRKVGGHKGRRAPASEVLIRNYGQDLLRGASLPRSTP